MQDVNFSITLKGRKKKKCSPQPAHTEAPQHLFQSVTQRQAALGPTFPPYHHRASASYCRKRPPVSQRTSQRNQDYILVISQTSWWISWKLSRTWMWAENASHIFWCWYQRVCVQSDTVVLWCCFICPFIETLKLGPHTKDVKVCHVNMIPWSLHCW